MKNQKKYFPINIVLDFPNREKQTKLGIYMSPEHIVEALESLLDVKIEPSEVTPPIVERYIKAEVSLSIRNNETFFIRDSHRGETLFIAFHKAVVIGVTVGDVVELE